MTAYEVTVTRESNLWVADVKDRRLAPAAMDYEHLADLHEDLPSFIADIANVDPDDVEIAYRYEVNGRDLTAPLQRLMNAEQELRRLQAESERARKEALATMADAGLSQRAMADAVGLSHQRVQQLVKAI